MDIEKDGRSTHCYCENPRALGFRNYHNRDTMGFTTSHLGISLMTSIIGNNRLACSFQYNTFFENDD